MEDVLVGRVRLQLVHFHDAAEQCVAHSAKNRGCDRYSGLRHRHASVIGHLTSECVAHSAKNRGCDRYSGLRHRHASVRACQLSDRRLQRGGLGQVGDREAPRRGCRFLDILFSMYNYTCGIENFCAKKIFWQET